MMRAVLLLGFAGCSTPMTKPAPPPASSPSENHADHHANHGGGMHHRFDNADEWAKVFDDPERDAWQQPDKVIASLELAPAMTVADIGAGTGYFTVRLARAVPQGRVIATDIEETMVRHLTERAAKASLTNIEGRTTPADDPQLGPQTVDRIVVVDVWHHLGDRTAYAKKLASGLRTGGSIHIVDFKLDATRGPPPAHRLAPAAIVAELAAAGLDASISPVALPDQYIVVGKRR